MGGAYMMIRLFDSGRTLDEVESAEYQAVVGKRLAATEGYAVLSQSMNVG